MRKKRNVITTKQEVRMRKTVEDGEKKWKRRRKWQGEKEEYLVCNN